MPLSESDMQWPPVDDRIQYALADWDAWYSSEPDRLEARYSGRGYLEAFSWPSQHRGSVIGRLARWFWGQPTPDGEKRDKLHVPLAGDIARTSSELLFSEPPKLLAAEDASNATQDALNALMEGGLQPTLLEAGEICAALGGAYLRVVWDDAVSDQPWIDTVAADRTVREFRYGRLTTVTFWTVLETEGRNDNRVFRHLERHERGRIYHGLYEGSASSLGAARPLAEHPETAPLAAMVDAEGCLDTGPPHHLTAAYVPNVRPARAWRHIPTAAYWGQSDFQGVEGLMDQLDETYSSWMRDVQNGRDRIVVPTSMLDPSALGRAQHGAKSAGSTRGSRCSNDPATPTRSPLCSSPSACRNTATLAPSRPYARPATPLRRSARPGTVLRSPQPRSARERRNMGSRGRKALYWGPAVANITAAFLAVQAASGSASRAWTWRRRTWSSRTRSARARPNWPPQPSCYAGRRPHPRTPWSG
ncbi:hypothetical protein BN159_6003 [Streptomyces davaonensis JCM 4913]|uniref:Uncharacterized protein n=1 Tax=Streptomyces davaonensis (strain DSM 101723 / JCM 4913 / KCC S-0913 / 768) TaxID=1214101 RepID=K4RAX3_STRDJ|nr:hypothetical protein [Streptomyces davaonensis]CCK30382.1 hypothetical protein BN159_6003 [Streptomyces davaonensis JCM 4913]